MHDNPSIAAPAGATVVGATRDPVIQQLREQISDADGAIVEALNNRLKLVARMKRYKQTHGVPFVDLAREEWMLSYLLRANRGPLSREGLSEIYAEILDLTKRELGRGGAAD